LIRSGRVMCMGLLDGGGLLVALVLLAAVVMFGCGRLSRLESETRVVAMGWVARLITVCWGLSLPGCSVTIRSR
jgi:hypothetical protein